MLVCLCVCNDCPLLWVFMCLSRVCVRLCFVFAPFSVEVLSWVGGESFIHLALFHSTIFVSQEALEHPYVASFHNEVDELSCERVISLPFDENTRLTLKDYRDKIYNDILRRRSRASSFPSLALISNRSFPFLVFLVDGIFFFCCQLLVPPLLSCSSCTLFSACGK